MSATAGSAEFTTRAAEILSGHGSLETDVYLRDRSRRLATIYNVANCGSEMLSVNIALPPCLFELAGQVGSDVGLSIGEVVEAWMNHGFTHIQLLQCAGSDHDVKLVEAAVRASLSEFATERVELSRKVALYCRALPAAIPVAALLALTLPDTERLSISRRDPTELRDSIRSSTKAPKSTAAFASLIAIALPPQAKSDGTTTIDVTIPNDIATLAREIGSWIRTSVQGVLGSAITGHLASFCITPQEQPSFVRAAELLQLDISEPRGAFSYATIEAVSVSEGFLATCERMQRWFGVDTDVCGGLAALRGVDHIVERLRNARAIHEMRVM